MRRLLEDFRLFIARGNVVDLAVAVVVGGAFGAITNSLVSDIIMPPIGALVGRVDFSDLGVILGGAGRYDSVREAVAANAPVLRYGAFLTTVVEFVIIAFAMFLVVKGTVALQGLRRKEVQSEEAEEAELPIEVALLQEIRDLLAERRERP